MTYECTICHAETAMTGGCRGCGAPAIEGTPRRRVIDDRAIENQHEILRAVIEYRAACDAIGPAWEAFAPLYLAIKAGEPESTERHASRLALASARRRVDEAHKRLLELALDGRSEVSR